MKKRRLKKWVKITLTIVLAIVSILVYVSTGITGELAQSSNIWLLICCGEWFYLFFIQGTLCVMIWEN